MCKSTFVFSSTNSGKSLSLLAKNYMLKQKGFDTLLMKPDIDDQTTTISSRLGIEGQCVIVAKDILPSVRIFRLFQSNQPKVAANFQLWGKRLVFKGEFIIGAKNPCVRDKTIKLYRWSGADKTRLEEFIESVELRVMGWKGVDGELIYRETEGELYHARFEAIDG